MDSVTVSRGWSPSLRTPAAFGLLLALVTAAAWFALPMKASAYPECIADFHVSATTVKARQRIVLTASCDYELRWRATFAGEVRTGAGRNFREVFTAPDPSANRQQARTTIHRLEVVGVGRPAGATQDVECRRSFDITVTERGASAAPAANPSQPALPSTGGPQLALLGLAILLLLAGAASIRRARQARPEC